MDNYVASSDGDKIHYVLTGHGEVALVFIHGALGNAAWWDAQQEAFSGEYTVVQIDLPGHGKSGRSRRAWSSAQYARDVQAVVDEVLAPRIVLVGHSMSGAYSLEASTLIHRTRAVILVDTLKNLDEVLSFEEANELILKPYRLDFKRTVEELLPRYVFGPATPPQIRRRLQDDFLAVGAEVAAKGTEPLYRMDLQAEARRVAVPVRAINSDAGPTNVEGNRKYFRDYDCVTISGTGHYPMVERPQEFNRLLGQVLRELIKSAGNDG